MLDEKKLRETCQAGISEDGNSVPLQETKGDAGLDSAVVVDGEDRVNFFVWLLVACSSISGLLFGASSIQFIPLLSVHDHSHTNGPSIVINVCTAVNRLRHWCHLWCARYHRFRSRSNGALLWSKGLLS